MASRSRRGARRGRWWASLAIGGLFVGFGPTLPARGATAGTRLSPISPSSPCGVVSRPPAYQHVVWILLENAGYAEVVSGSEAPYLGHLASVCGLATNYLAISHPSLPNYLALTSGSTHGVADDGEPDEHPIPGPSLFSELGSNWRALEESMPGRCDLVTSGQYAARHNPAVYYTALRASCERNDVPFSTPLDLAAAFTFITPNICDDMHSCPISTGDAWLAKVVPEIVESPQYQARDLVLAITFDEADSGPDNQVATFVVAPSVHRGTKVPTALTHYSLLRTTEQLLHVAYLGGAARATSMLGPFNL